MSEPVGCDALYWGVSGLPDHVVRGFAEHRCAEMALDLDVPLDHIHAYWHLADHMDPLDDTLFIGYRSDWGRHCERPGRPRPCTRHGYVTPQ